MVKGSDTQNQIWKNSIQEAIGLDRYNDFSRRPPAILSKRKLFKPGTATQGTRSGKHSLSMWTAISYPSSARRKCACIGCPPVTSGEFFLGLFPVVGGNNDDTVSTRTWIVEAAAICVDGYSGGVTFEFRFYCWLRADFNAGLMALF